MCNCGKCAECKGQARKEGKSSAGYTHEKKETTSQGNGGKSYKKEEYTEKKENE